MHYSVCVKIPKNPHTKKRTRTNKWIQCCCKTQGENQCICIYHQRAVEKGNRIILFTVALRRLKYWGINLTKEVQDFIQWELQFAERNESLSREIFHVHSLEDSIFFKRAVFFKLIYRFNTIMSKFQHFFLSNW